MGWRGPIVLALLAAGLAWLALRDEPAAPSESIAKPALQGRSIHRAERLRIRSGPERPTVVLVRGARGFRLVEPIEDEASNAFIDQLAAQWDAARLTRFAEAAELGDEGLRDKGLLPPRAEFAVEFDDGTTQQFELGTQALLPHEIYVRVGGVVHRGHLGLFSSLQGNVDDLRERLVLMHPPDQVEELTLVRRLQTGGEMQLGLARTASGWELRHPRRMRADAAQAWQLVQAISGILVEQFVPGNVSAVRGEPELRFIVRGAMGEEVVEFWREASGSLLGYAPHRDLHFRILSTDLSRIFEVPLDSLRSRLLLPFPVERLTRIRIEGEGREPLELRRGVGDGWRMHQPHLLDTDPTAVAELLAALRALVIEEFVDEFEADPARRGLDAAAIEVELTESTGRPPVRLRVGAAVEGRVLARRVDEEVHARVPAEPARLLRRSWNEYAGRDVLQLGLPGAVPRLEIRVRGGKRLLQLAPDGKWHEEGEPGVIAGAQEVVERLQELRATAVHDAGALPEPQQTIRFSLQRANGDELGWLEVSVRGDKTVVQSPRVPGVLFELRERDATLLTSFARGS